MYFKRVHIAFPFAIAIIIGLVLIPILWPVSEESQSSNNNNDRNETEAPIWTYICERDRCVKHRFDKASLYSRGLDSCRLSCGRGGSLWPLPTGKITMGKELVHIDPENIEIFPVKSLNAVEDLVQKAFQRFQANVAAMAMKQKYDKGGQGVMISIAVQDTSLTNLLIDTDESYAVVVESNQTLTTVKIESANFFGARHGLETLSQLIAFDKHFHRYEMVQSFRVEDSPKFKVRGLMLDTARSYLTIDSIKRTIEGMAMSKLNTLHWHISDSQSFPFVSKALPQLSVLGAYDADSVYTIADIKEIAEYSLVRGIKIIPELDAPAHIGEGWQDTGLIVCLDSKPWPLYCEQPPCGHFDPTLPKLYDTLEQLYAEFIEAFAPEIFHMGGDEVSFRCWNSTKTIKNWMQDRKIEFTEAGFVALWTHYQKEALARYRKLSKGPVMLWASHLTQPEVVEKSLPKDDYIIHVWTEDSDSRSASLLDKGYRLILSTYTHLYLDCGFGAWVQSGLNWCAPYIPWQDMYENAVGFKDHPNRHLVLGSIAALWGEQADGNVLDSRTWPRTAAVAERLWTDPKFTWRAADSRMLMHRERLVRSGIAADTIQPKWCVQNEGECPLSQPVH